VESSSQIGHYENGKVLVVAARITASFDLQVCWCETKEESMLRGGREGGEERERGGGPWGRTYGAEGLVLQHLELLFGAFNRCPRHSLHF
jgi:hypothetical protein